MSKKARKIQNYLIFRQSGVVVLELTKGRKLTNYSSVPNAQNTKKECRMKNGSFIQSNKDFIYSLNLLKALLSLIGDDRFKAKSLFYPKCSTNIFQKCFKNPKK